MLPRLGIILWLIGLLAAPDANAQSVATGQVLVTPSSGAYVSGYCLGPAGASAVLAFTSLMRGGDNTTIISEETIVDSTGNNAAIDLLVFNNQPTGTYTDHAACNVAAADQPFLIGTVVNTSFTCIKDSSSASGICQATTAILAQPTNPPKLNTIWIVPIVRGTPTYGASKSLWFNVSALPG